jgi:hypothetical protein
MIAGDLQRSLGDPFRVLIERDGRVSLLYLMQDFGYGPSAPVGQLMTAAGR